MSSSRSGYHHGDLAHALETAAMQLLADRPAQEISLREVARAADVSHNAPYHHFADRRGLLKTLAERSMADLVGEVRSALESAPDPVTALIAGGQAYIRFAVERPNAFDVVYDPAVCIPDLRPRPWRRSSPSSSRCSAVPWSAWAWRRTTPRRRGDSCTDSALSPLRGTSRSRPHWHPANPRSGGC
ncbi:TetR/AcrR family transcriptional regulator [Microbacterium sp. KUDC0406]|uniref:TetR/AcrR family transcriptional regulator n=1 Tax=Microbacterium sp. KUDC0406 TaxID=2909588 RepID=UPI001F3BB5F0|nr:TetR/AcrR family transcriptional regulator [Microbacterium sp. KUDC0406]UJP09943.1 TetR/AcrR family transcriptional regulator [Microbacterium sp. KUDC0406]